ncbi:MAG TPA: tetratricopeptide repeat protein, partial [Caldithrix sp.]|nr:tetratricopeptide repeat protein [Caldithrix sp.]
MRIRKPYLPFILFFLFLLGSGAAAQQKRFIAILPFSNTGSGEYDWVARGIEEILYDKFSNLHTITVFEKETFDRILRKSNVHALKDLTLRKAFQLGKETGTDVLIAGTYKVSGSTLVITYKAVSTYTGANIFDRTFQGPLANIYSLNKTAISEIMNVMGLPTSDSEKRMLAKSSTKSAQAFKYYCKAYTEFRKGSSIEVVASYFTRALGEDPNFWEAQYNLGVIYYNFDKYERASEQFKKVIAQNPKFYKPYYGLGVIYYLQRNYRQAAHNFKKVLSIQKDHDRSLYYLGRVYIRLDSLEKGLEYLEKSAKLNPNYAPTQYQIALTNMKRGWYKTAVLAFKKSLKLNPDNYRAHNSLGECYYFLQRFDDAIYQYKKAVELRPDFSTAYFNLGNTVYKRGALQEIVSAYLEILETRYTRSSSRANLQIAEDLKKLREKENPGSAQIYREMISAYRKALRYETGFFEASFNLALTYENLSRIDSAIYYYQQSIRSNPKLVRAHMRLGRIYERQERYTEALQQFKKVVEIEPSYFTATPRLGEPYRYINI